MVAEERGKILIYAQYTGPGPLAYKLKPTLGRENTCPTFHSQPAYSLKAKQKYTLHDGPGPHYVVDPCLTSRGRQLSPAYSLQSRPPVKGVEWSPGPGHYKSDRVKGGTLSREYTSPKLTFGSRTVPPFKNCSPPASKYHKPSTLGQGSPTTRSAPAWLLKGRQDHNSIYYSTAKDNIPGPATYGATDARVFKRKSCEYSLGGRTKVKDYNTANDAPGPGTYESIPTPRKSGPTMGSRHSQYMTMYLTSGDVC